MGYITSTVVLSVQWKQKETRSYKERIMKWNRLNNLWWWIVIVSFSLSVGCVSQSIPQKECCSSGVECTSVSDTKVNLDLVKKDGVIIILPTITTDTIK